MICPACQKYVNETCKGADDCSNFVQDENQKDISSAGSTGCIAESSRVVSRFDAIEVGTDFKAVGEFWRKTKYYEAARHHDGRTHWFDNDKEVEVLSVRNCSKF